MFGRLLEVNLSTGKTRVFNVDLDVIKAFIGGKGLGAYLLYKFLEPGTDPLSPSNPLMFLTGPLTGTPYPTSGRMVVVTKSPLTGLYLDSHAGGYFGSELRMAGYDGVIVVGRASSPVYIWITSDSIEIRGADRIWGKTVSETVDMLRHETHPRAHAAVIGPAGENLVKFAGVFIDKDDDPWRAGIAARGGPGAVMGSKNLKGVVVKATGRPRIEYADREKFMEVAKRAMDVVNTNKFMKIRKAIGTSFWVEPMNRFGILPTMNFRRGYMENATGLYGEYLRAFVKRIASCYNCPVACGKIVETEGGDVKVEYEDLALLGSNCLIDDAVKVAKSLKVVNELGLDAISTGNVVAFAMELGELGLLEGAPKWGDLEGQIDLIKKIAYREGIGDLLAEGVARAARKIGGKAEEVAIHVKGLELPGYEPRSSWGMALAYATSDRGGCHQRAWTTRAEIEGPLRRFSTEGVPEFVKDVQDERAAAYSLIVCDFIPLYNPWEAVAAAVGIEFDEEDYLRAGERIWTLTRLFNIREAGISRKDDTLPPRMFKEPLPLPPDGSMHVLLPKYLFDRMLDRYYKLRRWDCNGIPTRGLVEDMGLHRFFPDIISYASSGEVCGA